MSDTQACHIILIPGFTSPKWMLSPLYWFLSKRFDTVELWDHPHIFSDPGEVVEQFRQKLELAEQKNERVALVSHSFGDWIARNALSTVNRLPETMLVSLAPVIDKVPIALPLSWLAFGLAPELSIMADERSAAHAEIPKEVTRHIIWSRWEIFVRRPRTELQTVHSEQTVNATHASLIFQRSVWKKVAAFLEEFS